MTFFTHDTTGKSISLTVQIIFHNAENQLTAAHLALADLLAASYATQECNVLKQHPESAENNHFLSSLAPQLNNHPIDWMAINQQAAAIFSDFFKQTNFDAYLNPGECFFLVTARDAQTNEVLGCIFFIQSPTFGTGTIKAGTRAFAPAAQHRGIEKIIMSSIFLMVPTIQKLFIHTRTTNTEEIDAALSWGFVSEQPANLWINLTYDAMQHNQLQQVAATFIQ